MTVRKNTPYTSLGVEISADRRTTWVALAGTADGVAVVDLLDPHDGTDAVGLIVTLAATHPVAAVAIDPRSNAATLLDALEQSHLPLLRVDSSGMAVAWGRFHDWTLDGRLKHRGHPDLTAAVRLAAGRRTAAGAQAVDRRSQAFDPAPVVAAELAVYGLDQGFRSVYEDRGPVVL